MVKVVIFLKSRLLFISSSHVYGFSNKSITENKKRIPINSYGKSKKKVEDYKLSRNNMVKDISNMKKQAQKSLTTSLNSILAEYAKKNSVAYIIPKQHIIIGKVELDITNIILEILNSKIKNIKL